MILSCSCTDVRMCVMGPHRALAACQWRGCAQAPARQQHAQARATAAAAAAGAPGPEGTPTSAAAAAAQLRGDYERDGYVVARGVLDDDVIGELSDHVQFIARRYPRIPPEHYHHIISALNGVAAAAPPGRRRPSRADGAPAPCPRALVRQCATTPFGCELRPTRACWTSRARSCRSCSPGDPSRCSAATTSAKCPTAVCRW